MDRYKIAIVVGSLRKDSINRKIARSLCAMAHDRLDCDIVPIDDLPLYNQDLEAELPKSVARLKAELAAADGLLFVTAEHNRSIPAVLKNAIDWGARPYGRNSWAEKPAAITGTSPGAVGTAVAQQHLRQILGDIGVLVMGGEAYISFKPGLIDQSGTIADDSTRGFLKAFIEQFAVLVARMSFAHEAAA